MVAVTIGAPVFNRTDLLDESRATWRRKRFTISEL